jgi:hypothetical protein
MVNAESYPTLLPEQIGIGPKKGAINSVAFLLRFWSDRRVPGALQRLRAIGREANLRSLVRRWLAESMRFAAARPPETATADLSVGPLDRVGRTARRE